MAHPSSRGQTRQAAKSVPQVVYAAQALDDLERLMNYLLEYDAGSATQAVGVIISAVDALQNHPLIGRRVEGELRELVISFGKTGYMALYRFVPLLDEVRILAIRHQRELDYPV